MTSLPENKYSAEVAILNDKLYIIAGRREEEDYSSKVYAADLPAPAMNLYFKEGNATAEAELSTLGMADGSVTLGQSTGFFMKIGLDHNPATAEGSLLAVPRGEQPPRGYALYKRFDVNGSLKWEKKASVIVPRWAFDGVEALDGKIYFAGGHDGVVRNLAERYDPLTNQWENLTPMSEARDGMAAAVLNGKFSCHCRTKALNSVEIYDPSNRTMCLSVQPVPAALVCCNVRNNN